MRDIDGAGHHPGKVQPGAVEVPAPVARFFREAGITQETLRDLDDLDRYWLAVLGEESAGRRLSPDVSTAIAAMAAAGVAAVADAPAEAARDYEEILAEAARAYAAEFEREVTAP